MTIQVYGWQTFHTMIMEKKTGNEWLYHRLFICTAVYGAQYDLHVRSTRVNNNVQKLIANDVHKKQRQ